MPEENKIYSWESDILEQLDSCAQEYNFPMFNNIYFDYADARLTALRSSSEWLIIFEEIVFSKKQRLFINSISAYGSEIVSPGTQEAITIISDAPGCSVWDESGNFLLNPWDFEIQINGELERFSFSSKDYEKQGIDTSSDMSMPAQILRLLTGLSPSRFFLGIDRLLEVCGRTEASLELFLQLEDWFHPDIADDEIPSKNMCFQQLALAISRNNKNEYSCSEDKLNTHWLNWNFGLTN